MIPQLVEIQEAIRKEHFHGWLFYNFNHRDSISDTILNINPHATNSRRWVYMIPGEAPPVAICHRIEPDILKHLPGETFLYSGMDEFISLLKRFKGLELAAQYSPENPSISFLDAGMFELCVSCGITLRSSSSLIQRHLGLLSQSDIESHFRAADHLYEIIRNVWSRIKNCVQLPLEKEVMTWINQEFIMRKLVTVHSPIVGSGMHSRDPHFDTLKSEKRIGENEVLQFDIWGKEPDGIWADISWIGFTGTSVPKSVSRLFSAVTDARDYAVEYIRQSIESTQVVTGSDIDAAVRHFIQHQGFGHGILHRTGHSIDRTLHGWGTNIDSYEFPDTRQLLDGSCFSIEPGIYLEDFGMRSEINCILHGHELLISGPGVQKDILAF